MACFSLRTGPGRVRLSGSGPVRAGLWTGFCRQSFRRAVLNVLCLVDASMESYLCWGDLMDVGLGSTQIFRKTLKSINFDPNAPEIKWANTKTLKIKHDFEAPGLSYYVYTYVYIYISVLSRKAAGGCHCGGGGHPTPQALGGAHRPGAKECWDPAAAGESPERRGEERRGRGWLLGWLTEDGDVVTKYAGYISKTFKRMMKLTNTVWRSGTNKNYMIKGFVVFLCFLSGNFSLIVPIL